MVCKKWLLNSNKWRRERKPVSVVAGKYVAKALQEQTYSDAGISSAREIGWILNMPNNTVRKVLRNILSCYPCKIAHVQELLPADLEACHSFALQFLARTKVNNGLPWYILWSDEAYFYLQNSINTQNCRIWATKNQFQLQPLPLQSEKVTFRCGIMTTFIAGPFYLEEITSMGPVICAASG